MLDSSCAIIFQNVIAYLLLSFSCLNNLPFVFITITTSSIRFTIFLIASFLVRQSNLLPYELKLENHLYTHISGQYRGNCTKISSFHPQHNSSKLLEVPFAKRLGDLSLGSISLACLAIIIVPRFELFESRFSFSRFCYSWYPARSSVTRLNTSCGITAILQNAVPSGYDW